MVTYPNKYALQTYKAGRPDPEERPQHMSYLSAGAASRPEPKGLGVEREHLGQPRRSHWVPSSPDPEKSRGREQEALELSDLLSTSCSPETAKCCSDSAAPYGAVWEGITSLIPCLQSQK